MYFLRSTRILICGLAVLIPAAARTIRPEGRANSAADLVEKVQQGKTVVRYDDKNGYLRSLLRALDVPVSSQTLVFSKSSFQLSQIAPAAPRAVYFNDDVYIGWVNHGQFIEIADVEPRKGPTFYTLTEEDSHPV